MATVTITLASVCPGGNHLRFTDSLGGEFPIDLESLDGPLTERDRLGFLRTLYRIGRMDKTRAQVKTLFDLGVSVTV